VIHIANNYQSTGAEAKEKMTKKKLTSFLNKIIKDDPESMRAYVADEWLENVDEYDKPDGWYNDLMNGGCQSGFISSLIYFTDTHKFFDKYYDEIEDIRFELEEATGESLKVNGDLKNWFAWLGFEETARTIAEELGIE